MLIVELKSEALKERHWKTLMRKLHVNWVLSDLNLGQVWDVDLQKNEMIVKDVILVAQGEMALEEFLKQVIQLFHLRTWVKCVIIVHGCLVVFVTISFVEVFKTTIASICLGVLPFLPLTGVPITPLIYI